MTMPLVTWSMSAVEEAGWIALAAKGQLNDLLAMPTRRRGWADKPEHVEAVLLKEGQARPYDTMLIARARKAAERSMKAANGVAGVDGAPAVTPGGGVARGTGVSPAPNDVQLDVSPPPAATIHVHHWRLDSPNGPTVQGVCGCGDTREFRTHLWDESGIVRSSRSGRLPR